MDGAHVLSFGGVVSAKFNVTIHRKGRSVESEISLTSDRTNTKLAKSISDGRSQSC